MNIAKRFFSSTAKKSARDLGVRVRYAPSPTGSLHIGGLRTALYNYLYAKKNNGTFILRIEDTDRTREVPGSVENITRGLSWAGLEWDEGPGASENTEFGPYYQSQRRDLYKKYADKLVENGDAYHCFCSADRLNELRESQMKKGEVTKYDGHCQKYTETEAYAKIRAGEKHVVRMRVPRGETEIKDIIHGKVKFSHKNVDDQVLLKSDGFPTYHLANVIDDHLMQISHVIRGEEWLTSLPKHIILYKALDFEVPEFAHLPLILNPSGGKLSKRQSHTAVDYYIERDFLPEALTNYVALLGWTPTTLGESSERDFKDEIFTLKELKKLFLLQRVVPSNAKLFESKLFYFNSFFMRKRFETSKPGGTDSVERVQEFRDKLCKYLPNLKAKIDETSDEKLKTMIPFVIDRIQLYGDAAEFGYLFELPDYKSEKSLKSLNKVKAGSDEARKVLRDLFESFEKVPESEYNDGNILKICSEYLYANKKTIKNEDVYHLLRYVLSGTHAGGPVGKMIEILGKDEVQKRIRPWL